MTLTVWLLVIFLSSPNGDIHANMAPFPDQRSCEAARRVVIDVANDSHQYVDIQADCIPENKDT